MAGFLFSSIDIVIFVVRVILIWKPSAPLQNIHTRHTLCLDKSEFRVDTFFWDRELAALGDLDRLDRLVTLALLAVLNLLNDIIALHDLAENDVTAIEPAGDDGGDEELGSVGVYEEGQQGSGGSSSNATHLCPSWPC